MAAAALSYAIVGLTTSLAALLASRVVVGLFKQTMTLSLALVADTTAPADRAAVVARLSAAVSVGWAAGQAVGGTLAEHLGERTPAAVAVALFVADALALKLINSNTLLAHSLN